MVSSEYPAIMKIILLIGLIIVISASKPEQFSHITPEKPYSGSLKTILFVGNSLTYTNDLPKLVVAFGKENGVEINTTILAYPNYALEDHWNDGQVQKLIAKYKYDFVVIQQGPSSQIDGRRMLFDFGVKIKTLCDNTNTQLAFFMVWPAFSNIQTFDGVIQNYTDAALATNSLLCPVGELWKKHFQDTGDYSFYGPDMFHPSTIGSKNAAKIIFETLFK